MSRHRRHIVLAILPYLRDFVLVPAALDLQATVESGYPPSAASAANPQQIFSQRLSSPFCVAIPPPPRRATENRLDELKYAVCNFTVGWIVWRTTVSRTEHCSRAAAIA
jgi:hypothetical protein